MKKYLSILVAVMLAAMSFTLTSCGDDDEDEPDNPQENAELLIGTWELTASSMPGTSSKHYSKFSEDGILLEVDIEDGVVEIERSKWSKKGDYIYATSMEPGFEDVTFMFTIKTLSNTELVVSLYGITQTFKRVPDSTIDKYL